MRQLTLSRALSTVGVDTPILNDADIPICVEDSCQVDDVVFVRFEAYSGKLRGPFTGWKNIKRRVGDGETSSSMLVELIGFEQPSRYCFGDDDTCILNVPELGSVLAVSAKSLEAILIPTGTWILAVGDPREVSEVGVVPQPDIPDAPPELAAA
jgi:hypothetical protein